MNTNIRLVLAAGIAASAGVLNAQSTQSVDEARGYAAELLADAQQRTSLLGQQSTAGSTFSIASDDGNFRLNISAFSQTRLVANFRDDANGDSFDSGFFIPRTRAIFHGNIVNPDTFYEIEFAFDDDGDPDTAGMGKLLDAYIGHNFGNGFTASVGQAKIAATREFMVDGDKRQLIESTVLDSVFSLGRAQGVSVTYTDEQDTLRIIGSFNDGPGSPNTPYSAENDGDIGISVRGDFAFQGTVGHFGRAINQMPGGETNAVLGVHLNFTENANAPGVDRMRMFQYGADFLYDSTEGWNFFGQFIGRYTDDDGAAEEFNDFGFSLQGGYFFSEQSEVFGAWDCVAADDDRAANVDPFNTFQVGLNHYPFPGVRDVKLSAGIAVFINQTNETGGRVNMNDRLGLMPDSEAPQFALLGQAQFGF